VSLGDLDGDGLLDLAVTNLNSNTVSVLLNTTTPGTIALTPSFATQQTFPTGVRPFSVSLGDVNGDGLIDLVIANQASNTVSVIQNTTPQPEIGNAVGTGTILNDDIATVSISSTRGIEGTNLVATATLSQVVDVDVTVTLTPSIQMGDTARASDLSLAPQTITIAAGQLTSSISIPTNDNTIVDGTRIFTLSLSNLSAMGRDVTLGVATTTGIILDNDGAPVDPPVIPPGSSNTRLYAVAAGSGGGPRVLVFNADGSLRFDFFAFSPDFLGGVSVATADIDGDTIDDIIVGAGPGGGPIVSVFRGTDQSLLTSFFALPQQFTGGVQVSAEDGGLIAIGAGPGGGPVVTLFQVTGSTVTMVNSFFAFSPLFTGGVSVGLEGTTLVVGAGAGGGPVVSVFNALTGAFQSSFFAFDATFTGGVSVAASTINGQLSILVGPGLGAAPAGQFNAQGQLQQAFSLPGSLGGIRVGFADRDGDGIDDTVLLGSGLFVPSTLRLLDLDGDELESLSPFGSVFTGGIFVG
jgi:hypothetical protein